MRIFLSSLVAVAVVGERQTLLVAVVLVVTYILKIIFLTLEITMS
jgi:hypothetical protein